MPRWIVVIVLVTCSMCLPMTRRSLAQEPVGESSSVFEPTLSGEIKVQDIGWEDLDYLDQELTVGSPGTWIHFDVPGDLEFVSGSYANMVLSHTAAGLEKSGSLTVKLNDHVLDIIQLTPENDDRAEIQLLVPPEYLGIGRNTLQATLSAGWDPCNRDEKPVEVVLHSEGFFHLEYEVAPRQPDLALYPVPFFERGFTPSAVCFVLPDTHAPEDITVATTISAGLGRYSSGQIEVRSVRSSELTTEILENYDLIAVGRFGANTFFSQLSLPLSLESADVADEHGVLQEVVSPWNPRRMVLVVTGATEEGMLKAGMALNRPILLPGLKGQVAIVEELLDQPEEATDEPVVDRTFEDMGYRDMTIYGTQPAIERIYFYLPPVWQVSGSPSLKLLFTHSEILTGTMSTLDVRLNEVPLAGTLLDRSNVQDGQLAVELFSWLLTGGSNRVDVIVDMSTGIDECLYWNSHQVWTVIRRNSVLHLPLESVPLALDLSNLFWPFAAEPNLSDTFIVLPETLGQAEQDALLSLSAQLGAAGGGEYIGLQSGQLDTLSSDLRQTHHIIAIGLPSTNPLIREINDFLPQPFLPDSDEPAQVHTSAVIAFDPQRSIGLVQLLASPWNPDKACLVVTGTDSEGLMAAFDLLVNSAWRLEGDLAMIEGENLTTMDTRPPQMSQDAKDLPIARLDTAVLVAQTERWW